MAVPQGDRRHLARPLGLLHVGRRGGLVGHEPGGGSGANCEATDNPLERTFFFLDADTGDSIGQFTIPRPQTNVENCTTHNYNVVPLRDRYVMVAELPSGIS